MKEVGHQCEYLNVHFNSGRIKRIKIWPRTYNKHDTELDLQYLPLIFFPLCYFSQVNKLSTNAMLLIIIYSID